MAKLRPTALLTPGPRGVGQSVGGVSSFFPRVWAVPTWFPVVAAVPGVFLNQHHFHFGWFVLNAFAVPSGTGRKGLSKKKVVSECVERKTACCVFLTIDSPERV